jgi:RNA polymerase sigma factor (sigma-70 family)
MIEAPETSRDENDLLKTGAGLTVPDAKVWFVREVLPLEAALKQFLRRHWRNKTEIDDLCQEVYARVFEAAQRQLPYPVKPFVFAAARNLLIDQIRHKQVVSIEAVPELDSLNVAIDEPWPDRSAMAREELRRLQAALDRLPPRCRDAVVMRKIEGLSRPEIAVRMGIAENTVNSYLTEGMRALADMVYGETAKL